MRGEWAGPVTAQPVEAGPCVRERVAVFIAGAQGMAAVDVARALDEAGLLAADPTVPAAPALTREGAARALAEMADGHCGNADVYLENPEYARQAHRRAQRRLVTSLAWEPGGNAQELAAAWAALTGGGRQ